jgi:lipoyl(octanoyl) transferase
MNKKTNYVDLNLIDYKEAWDYQENLFNEILAKKEEKRKGIISEETKNHLIFCEHPHVYTLGKSGEQNNLLITDEFLNNINATYYKSNRGGDITYHGPGQIVGYPIIDLENFNLRLKEYVHLLEESIIQTLNEFDINASRLVGATGVWLDINDSAKARKICAIGVRASRHVTMHGFAFNVNTDLNYFSYINPCGFIDKGVTSLEKELGEKQDFEKIKNLLKKNLELTFGFELLN